jgi:potassium-transporting ATPase KdpC subunit
MLSQLRSALLMTLVLTFLTGILYPLGITAISECFFQAKADGSLVTRNRAIVGSALIGQNFASQEYFHPRPSAAGTNGYDAAASSGSNAGPTNPDLVKRLQKDAAAYRSANSSSAPIPADAITTSGSGLDPDISPANALLQAGRVAQARHASSDEVRLLVERHIQGRQFGVLGEPRVNVLELNLALDRRFGR